MYFNFLHELNKEQRRAVQHTSGPAIILAGAGSGKTRVLTYKARYLIESSVARGENILMLTFTNKAADEMKKRIRTALSEKASAVTTSTFHTFAVGVLRHFNSPHLGNRDFVILDEEDQKSVIKNLLKENTTAVIKPYSLSSFISRMKNQLIDPMQAQEEAFNFYQEKQAELYSRYQERLKELNALDFDDLLFDVVTLLSTHKNARDYYHTKLTHILIDEYQDTNHAQYKLAQLLTNKNSNITIVGDMAQSIYSWRGADFRNLEKFKEDFPEAETFRLEENYRSSTPILDTAYRVISYNTTHPILELHTTKKGGEKVEVHAVNDSIEEARFVAQKIKELHQENKKPLNEIAVLYRINSQSRILEEALLNLGLPYRVYGGVRFYERKEIKDILAFARFILNPKDKLSYERIMKLGKKRGEIIIHALNNYQLKEQQPSVLIQSLLDKLPYLELYDKNDPEDSPRFENVTELITVASNFKTLSEFLDSVTLVETGYRFQSDITDKTNLMTLHAAKGLEFDTVFITGLEEGILPHSRSINSTESLEEERRLLYVGITRAKRKLYLTHAKRRQTYGRFQYSVPSTFLTESGLIKSETPTEDYF